MQNETQTNNDSTANMADLDRLSSLGELSAGLAHELNNAITVISRGNEQITSEFIEYLRLDPKEKKMFENGLRNGRKVSSAEARKQAKELAQKSNLGEPLLRDYAQTGLAEELILEDEMVAKRYLDLWDFGATLYETQLAIKQSIHVVDSMRSMASTTVLRESGYDINESIQNALVLLAFQLKNIQLTHELNDISTVKGDSGELIQIWTNIIKNAVDALQNQPVEDRNIFIKSEMDGNQVSVTIQDNGPGIPNDVINKIFDPHVTTKEKTKTSGLGLGLNIVQKIVNQYEGKISVSSDQSGTTFRVIIPAE